MHNPSDHEQVMSESRSVTEWQIHNQKRERVIRNSERIAEVVFVLAVIALITYLVRKF